MPWESRTVEKQREEFAKAALQCCNFSELCREHGITRKTGYKWRDRYLAYESMSDLSKRPHSSPNRTDKSIEDLILSVRFENPAWGPKKIVQHLRDRGRTDLPCTKTVANILHRYGCISPEESAKHKPFIRFEKELCNQMWQLDFKGEFVMQDGNYCYPLDIIDDHSRYCIKAAPHTTTANVVIPAFTEAFREFGLPDSILSDNGAQFAGFKGGYTQFERWLMELDVLPIHGRLKHPQTQGKVERFHRTMKDELLKHTSIADIDDACEKFAAWRDKYNCVRPHEALGMKCPAEVYEAGRREYKEKIDEYEYSGEHRVIKVNGWGYVRFADKQVYLSETMIGRYIEFRPSENGESFIACYRNFKIAEFDVVDGHLINRKISRL